MPSHRHNEPAGHWTLYPDSFSPPRGAARGNGIRLPSGEQAILFIAEARRRGTPTCCAAPRRFTAHAGAGGGAFQLSDGNAHATRPRCWRWARCKATSV